MWAALVDALGTLGAASGVTWSSTVYVAVSAGHIFGIALLFGPILLVDLTLVGLLAPWAPAATRRLERTAAVGASLAIVTGVLLTSARPQEYFANPAYLAKLAVVALALANAAGLRLLRSRTVPIPVWLEAGAGAMSLLAWITAVVLGRSIAFA